MQVRLFSLHVENPSSPRESGAGMVKEVHFKQSLFGHPSGQHTLYPQPSAHPQPSTLCTP